MGALAGTGTRMDRAWPAWIAVVLGCGQAKPPGPLAPAWGQTTSSDAGAPDGALPDSGMLPDSADRDAGPNSQEGGIADARAAGAEERDGGAACPADMIL